ncbi:shell matrix protein-like [Pecten maximus]|uniref:shell matrix protein-like n=1 Tax=Pecten maximus TaxID=6579 RepID=UPI001458251E|nr:shell matrix protein-like [Pecten maximus]
MSTFASLSRVLVWIFITHLVVGSSQFNFFNRRRTFRDTGNRWVTTTTEKPCELRAHSNNRRVFLMYVNGEWRKRPCALGTLFNQRTCDCSDHDPKANLHAQRCRAPLYVPFHAEPIKDHGGTNIAMDNNGRVGVSQNVGTFDGRGALTIWMYSGIYFGEHLGITFSFRSRGPASNTEQVLVSNCYYNSGGSVEIVIQPLLQNVVFRGTTSRNNQLYTANVSIPYKSGSWNSVTYSYDGVALTGNVNNQVKSSPLTGNIAVSPGSLRIGMCNGRGYNGDIDEFRLCQPILATLNQS